MDADNKPSFSVIEIEVNSLCNRSCSYCPVSILPIPDTPRYMPMTTFNKIMDELGQFKYNGLISYHLYNEPLIRKDLHELVKVAKSKIPDAYQLLFTNGDLLTDFKYDQLITAGIDHFLVTRHSNDHIKERPKQTVQFPTDLTLTNRGGLLDNVEKLEKSKKAPCYSPTDNLVITSSGDVLLCCDDASRKEVMGNLLQTSIQEIWFSNNFVKRRRLLQLGDRKAASKICEGCNNMEYLQPGGNYTNEILKKYKN